MFFNNIKWVSAEWGSTVFHFSSKMQERTVLFTFTSMAKPLSKLHVSNNRSKTDYDPQDIPLHYRMVNKIG